MFLKVTFTTTWVLLLISIVFFPVFPFCMVSALFFIAALLGKLGELMTYDLCDLFRSKPKAIPVPTIRRTETIHADGSKTIVIEHIN